MVQLEKKNFFNKHKCTTTRWHGADKFSIRSPESIETNNFVSINNFIEAVASQPVRTTC